MKKSKYKILVVILISIILAMAVITVNAVTNNEKSYQGEETLTLMIAGKSTAGQVIGDGDSFIQKGSNHASGIFSTSELQDLSSTIYNILLVVGIVIAVLLGAVLGIKFMMEGAEGKAEVQKALVPYVIGCVVIFGAFAIWKIVVTVLQGL